MRGVERRAGAGSHIVTSSVNPPAPGGRGAVRDRRRAQIAEAAARLLTTRPFSALTTREVAAAAGMGEATLFRHIRSKNDLLDLMFDDRLDALFGEIEQADLLAAARRASDLRDHDTTARVLRIYGARCDDFLTSPAGFADYLRPTAEQEEQRTRRASLTARALRLVSSILDEAQRRGALSRAVDVHLVARNCESAFVDEIVSARLEATDREIRDRLLARIAVQIDPLATD